MQQTNKNKTLPDTYRAIFESRIEITFANY